MIRSIIVEYINKGMTIEEIYLKEKCSKNTITNWMNKLNIDAPKGFYKKKGRKTGRPAGFKHSKEWKDKHRERMLLNNPFKSKKHSTETKIKMSKNHADFSGDKNPFRNSLLNDVEKRLAHKNRCKEIWNNRDEKWREDFGKKLSKSLANSSNFQSVKYHKNHKSCFVYYFDNIMFCRSSWEETIADYLYNNKLIYIFDIEPFSIKYNNIDNNERYTRIDFFVELINGKKIIFEVKPNAFIEQNILKIEGTVDFCLYNNYEFYILNEQYLKKDKFDKLIYNIYNDKYIGCWFKILDGLSGVINN